MIGAGLVLLALRCKRGGLARRELASGGAFWLGHLLRLVRGLAGSRSLARRDGIGAACRRGRVYFWRRLGSESRGGPVFFLNRSGRSGRRLAHVRTPRRGAGISAGGHGSAGRRGGLAKNRPAGSKIRRALGGRLGAGVAIRTARPWRGTPAGRSGIRRRTGPKSAGIGPAGVFHRLRKISKKVAKKVLTFERQRRIIIISKEATKQLKNPCRKDQKNA